MINASEINILKDYVAFAYLPRFRQEAQDRVNERGFAAAGLTCNAEPFSATNIQVNATHRMNRLRCSSELNV